MTAVACSTKRSEKGRTSRKTGRPSRHLTLLTMLCGLAWLLATPATAAGKGLNPAIQITERTAGDANDLRCADFDHDQFGFAEVQTWDARSVKDGNRYPLTLEVLRFEPSALKKSKLANELSDQQVGYYDIVLAYHTRFEGFTSLLVDNWLQKHKLFGKEYKQAFCRKLPQGNRLVLHAPFYRAGERPDDATAKERRADELIVPIIIKYVARQPDDTVQPKVANVDTGTNDSPPDGGNDAIGDLLASQQGRSDDVPADKSEGQNTVAGLSPAEELAVKQALQETGQAPAAAALAPEEPAATAPEEATGEAPEIQEAAAGQAPEGEPEPAVVEPLAPTPTQEPARAYPWTADFHLEEFVDLEEVFVLERTECGKAGNFFVGAVAQVGAEQAKSKDETVAVRRRAIYAANQFYGAGGDPDDRATVEASIDPSHFWCIPKREVCYKQVEFGQFGVAAGKDELTRVERNQIYNLRHGLAAAIQTMAGDRCLNGENLAGRRAE